MVTGKYILFDDLVRIIRNKTNFLVDKQGFIPTPLLASREEAENAYSTIGADCTAFYSPFAPASAPETYRARPQVQGEGPGARF